jgi:uncharacterized 2Fe-2S/4Fe-4S cluster protein (DUF4445 family)
MSMAVLYVLMGDREKTIHFEPGLTVREILMGNNIWIKAPCGGSGICGRCYIHIEGTVSDPSNIELTSISPSEFRNGTRLACQVRPLEDCRVFIDKLTDAKWQSLSEEYYSNLFHNIPLLPYDGYQYGVAVDLGTTGIRLSLWNMKKRLPLAGRYSLNPQASFGEDVLTRLMVASESEKHANKISHIVISSIGDVLKDISCREGYAPGEVGHVVIAGNTAMLALLSEKNYNLLLEPEYWMSEIDCQPEDTDPWKTSWGINENAVVTVVPPIAGFVGSDLMAAVLATHLTDGTAGSMLIDFGTNSEIALWDGNKLLVTSAAGGPAFEGCGINCGMPAEDGAVFRVELEEPGHLFRCDVIGGTRARGICGSALVDIIASMSRVGILNPVGKFTHLDSDDCLSILKGQNDLVIKKRDVDVFQRAKAAVAAGITCLLKKAGMSHHDLQCLYVCGAFGQFLNIRNAQSIGLLPEIPSVQVELCGNAALAGCEILLFLHDLPGILEPLKSKSIVINLAQEPLFEEMFIQNLYLQPMQMKGVSKC